MRVYSYVIKTRQKIIIHFFNIKVQILFLKIDKILQFFCCCCLKYD